MTAAAKRKTMRDWNQEGTISAREAAQHLGCHPDTVHRWINRDRDVLVLPRCGGVEVPVFRVGRAWRIPVRPFRDAVNGVTT